MGKVTRISNIPSLRNNTKRKKKHTKEDFKRLLHNDGPDGCA